MQKTRKNANEMKFRKWIYFSGSLVKRKITFFLFFKFQFDLKFYSQLTILEIIQKIVQKVSSGV